ncbi:MAG: lamin tail domain-containing protein [Gemmatimonadota bacterium]|nr:MAG: lamin tail domain-containing protein [Gemmatimonadota bacterium]
MLSAIAGHLAPRLGLTAICACAIGGAPCRQAETVELIFLDIGQGDAAVVRSPEGKVALIDAGRGAAVVGQLRAHGIESIDIAIASHPHADHIGGMEGVVTSMPVRYYMDNGVPHTTATYIKLMRTLQATNVTYLEATERTINLGSVDLTVIQPPPGGDLNSTSVGIVVEYGDFKALLTGDSEVGELNYWLERGVPDVTVLKAAHHGSRNGVSPTWLNATKPEVVVISCGLNNQYGHPDVWALRYYETVASEVYRTDLNGEVTILGRRNGDYHVQMSKGKTTAAEPRTEPAPVTTPAAAGLTLWVFADAPGNDHYNLNGEYVVITNNSSALMEIGGWNLCDAASACFTFPAGAVIPAGSRVVVYTGSGRSDGASFFMNRGRAVWNNRGDVATLWDSTQRMVARYAY